MKISLNWLGSFVEWKEKDPLKIAQRITACTAEVDAVELQGALLNLCCVGKVLSVVKHPNADKLSLCRVKTDQGEKKVVCGGTNLREGMRVAFAHVGACVLWHGEEMATLEKTKIRGEESEGMICAAEELGIASAFPECTGHSIVDLGDGDDEVGTPLKEYLGLTDAILDIDNHAITHRPDLFSHLGFARECRAMGIAEWKKDRPTFAAPAFTKDDIPFKHTVECKEKVPRYCACTLSIDDLGETPDWMKSRLEAAGMRSLNLPIDITNYVSLEVGMPLHSFDADDFKGDIAMRLSKKGEHIVTLDKEERELPDGALVLSDEEGIFDLMGIMGGLRSSTKEGTKHIYLHSAVVEPATIRNAIIATGHRTDAATVYEKGIPNVSAPMGLFRALELFLKYVPGAKITSKLDTWGDDGTAPAIPLSIEYVSRMLGEEIPVETIKKILTALEFGVEKKNGDLTVTPPLFRLGDISGPHDLVEEIGRMYGYDTMAAALPLAEVKPPLRDQRIHIMRDALKEEGFSEILPLSLLGPELLKRCNIDPASAAVIENPLGEELSILQPSTLPGLLEHAEKNLQHVQKYLRTFHWGQVFSATSDKSVEMGMLVAAKAETGIKDDPFLLLKAHFTRMLGQAGYAPVMRMAEKSSAAAHPGRAADLFVGEKRVGELFEIHPSVRRRFGLSFRASVALIDLSALLSVTPHLRLSKSLPQYPAVTYDLTIPLLRTQKVADILAKIRESSDLLESADIADLYADAPDTAQYNVTIRCVYRAQDRTLTEDEAKQAHKEVLKHVE